MTFAGSEILVIDGELDRILLSEALYDAAFSAWQRGNDALRDQFLALAKEIPEHE